MFFFRSLDEYFIVITVELIDSHILFIKNNQITSKGILNLLNLIANMLDSLQQLILLSFLPLLPKHKDHFFSMLWEILSKKNGRYFQNTDHLQHRCACVISINQCSPLLKISFKSYSSFLSISKSLIF